MASPLAPLLLPGLAADAKPAAMLDFVNALLAIDVDANRGAAGAGAGAPLKALCARMLRAHLEAKRLGKIVRARGGVTGAHKQGGAQLWERGVHLVFAAYYVALEIASGKARALPTRRCCFPSYAECAGGRVAGPRGRSLSPASDAAACACLWAQDAVKLGADLLAAREAIVGCVTELQAMGGPYILAAAPADDDQGWRRGAS